MCAYGAHLFYVCCSDCVGVCGNVCCVASVIKDNIFLALECSSMLYVCVRGVMDVVFSVSSVTRGARCARVWEVWVFRHADVVCLCLVCIMWQLSMRGCKRRPYGRGILQSRSHDCHECLLLFTPSCCCECFYNL